MNKHTTTRRVPRLRRLALAAAVSTSAGVLAGCSFWGSEVRSGESGMTRIEPDNEGMYAYQGDGLVRLDGDLEWEQETWGERNDLAPGSTFVIRDPALMELAGTVQQSVGLRKVAWVRSEISETGTITPVTGTKWSAAALPGLEVPLDYAQPSGSESDVLQVQPLEPLEPGLYSFYMDAGEDSRKARIGIAWPRTDKQAYAAGVCVDRYVGRTTGYRLCGEQTAAGSAEALQIYLVEPQTQSTGSTRSMVVSGVILNDSNDVRNVPVLAGELRDAAGSVLTRWRFEASGSRLKPGQSTSFRNEITGVPPRTHSVNVNFDAAQASN